MKIDYSDLRALILRGREIWEFDGAQPGDEIDAMLEALPLRPSEEHIQFIREFGSLELLHGSGVVPGFSISTWRDLRCFEDAAKLHGAVVVGSFAEGDEYYVQDPTTGLVREVVTLGEEFGSFAEYLLVVLRTQAEDRLE